MGAKIVKTFKWQTFILAKYLHDKINENFAAILTCPEIIGRGPVFETEKVEPQFKLF